MKVCVLGLGNMGLPVAINLARAGHDVTGANIAPVPAASEAGVAVSTDATEALRDREVVFCLLPDLPYLEPMLPALLDGGAADLVVMSTISPSAVRGLAERLDGQVNVMDACMSGGVAKAEDGSMSIMCGADEAMFERVRPLLDVIGGTVELMGPVGAGAVTKACNQMVVAGTLVALGEATLVAKDNGLDAHHVLQVLGAGLAASELLDQKAAKLADEDFSPSGPAKFLVKDLTFATDSAGGRDLPSLQVSLDLFTGLTEAGLGDDDNSVVLQYLRQIS
ncbi:MAG: NAD(P)-dependent oxidoreductase [Micropruina glycogenica]